MFRAKGDPEAAHARNACGHDHDVCAPWAGQDGTSPSPGSVLEDGMITTGIVTSIQGSVSSRGGSFIAGGGISLVEAAGARRNA